MVGLKSILRPDCDVFSQRKPAARIDRLVALALVLAGTIAFVGNTVIPESTRFKYDFACFYTAWYAAQTGLDFYDPLFGQKSGDSPLMTDIAQQAGVPLPVPQYAYSPAFAALGLLLPLPSYRTAEVAWVWVNAFLWLGCIGLLIQSAVASHALAGAGLFLAATFFPPADFTLQLGQLNTIVLVLIVLTLWALRWRHDAFAGAMIGLAMLSKTHVGFFWVYFLFRRRWQAATSTVITLGVAALFSLVALGEQPWKTYVNNVLPMASQGFAYIANQSVHAVLARTTITDPALLFSDGLIPAGAPVTSLGRCAALLILVVTLAVVMRSGSKASLSLEVSAVTLALLLAAPVATIHHFTWAYLPIVILCGRLLTQDIAWRRSCGILLVTGIGLLFIPWPLFFSMFLGHAGWIRLLACNTFAGALSLWLISLMLIRATHRDSSLKLDVRV